MSAPIPKTTYSAVLGSVLARLRNQREVGQADLASRLGINQSSLSRIERGATPVSVELLVQIARALGCRESRIMRLTENAVDDLQRRGVLVEYTRQTSAVDRDTVIVGAAAIAAIVGGILAATALSED